MEAVVPIEVLNDTARMKVKQLDVSTTSVELDLLDEVRDKVDMKIAAHKRKDAGYFNPSIKPRAFQSGDLVLSEVAAAGHHLSKLGPNWERPYGVI